MYRLLTKTSKISSKCLKKFPKHGEAIGQHYRQLSSSFDKISELAPAYQPSEVEKLELQDEFFKPPIRREDGFRLILPPPNVTGTLHLGHALTATIQDVLVKWNRMRGIETTWIPGLDHAGIATQVIVEKKLWSEKKLTRHDIGRDAFVAEVWKWKDDKSHTIGRQLRRLGVSLDWHRECFTMDERQTIAVAEAFVRLYEDGLVYEADRLVNWSCNLQSAISDIEVDHMEINGPTNVAVPGYQKPVRFGLLTKFAYKLKDSDEEIVVATTRPETMLGDVAVAVHPSDSRFSSHVGRQLLHPFRNSTIPIIADDFVDPNFGTGAVKITPGHNHVDFDAAKRHDLEILQVIDETGKITSDTFKNLPRFEARTKICNSLNELGLLRGVEDHAMIVPICSRSKDVIEFLVKPQYFVNCKQMAEKAVQAVRNGDLVIEPRQFEKNWFDWLENIRDWCVSRQLWWGHRIPIYVCQTHQSQCKVAARSEVEARTKASKILQTSDFEVSQVDDVLDTWFSSGLLPFSSFGWPKNDVSGSYPLSLMETGHDILFFWVARMVMLGTQLTGQLPFNKILLHGIICDSSGRKMSKSLGNVIAPEDIITGKTLKELELVSKSSLESGILSKEEFGKAVSGQKKMFPLGIPECGADALRFTLCSHNIKSHYINFDVQECKTNKMFGNKVWQATKFTVKWCEEISKLGRLQRSDGPNTNLTLMDRWILSRMAAMVNDVNLAIQNHDFHNATQALKNFIYYEFCDVYLECTKKGFKDPTSREAATNCLVLSKCLDVGLRCLSPFMPHLSPHLHRFLVHPEVLGSPKYFPKESPELINKELEQQVAQVLICVTGIRRLMKIFNVSAKTKPRVIVMSEDSNLPDYTHVLNSLTGSMVSFKSDQTAESFVSDTLSNGLTIRLCVPKDVRRAFAVDADKMEKKRQKLMQDLQKLRNAMNADGYAKVSTEGHQNNLNKVEVLQEKIGRIDYIRSFTKQH